MHKVELRDTAKAVGSGSLEVFSTPMMVALMEASACELIAEKIPSGKTTVGISLDIEHLSATPVGMEVFAQAELMEEDGKVFTFKVSAYDEVGLIGKGVHKRALVNIDRFMERANGKQKSE